MEKKSDMQILTENGEYAMTFGGNVGQALTGHSLMETEEQKRKKKRKLIKEEFYF